MGALIGLLVLVAIIAAATMFPRFRTYVLRFVLILAIIVLGGIGLIYEYGDHLAPAPQASSTVVADPLNGPGTWDEKLAAHDAMCEKYAGVGFVPEACKPVDPATINVNW